MDFSTVPALLRDQPSLQRFADDTTLIGLISAGDEWAYRSGTDPSAVMVTATRAESTLVLQEEMTEQFSVRQNN